jgi:hypothetical protein
MTSPTSWRATFAYAKRRRVEDFDYRCGFRYQRYWVREHSQHRYSVTRFGKTQWERTAVYGETWTRADIEADIDAVIRKYNLD